MSLQRRIVRLCIILTLLETFFVIDLNISLWTKQKGTRMAKVPPFHSIKQDVHHNNDTCTEGNNIEKENLRQGTGGKPLCKNC